jgi:hypothetical protein
MNPSDELESKDGRIDVGLAFRGTGPQSRVGRRGEPTAVAAVRPYQLNLTGSQLLAAATFALCLASLCLWLVRYWLFAK